MPALQVRDFPDDLYAELKNCAAEEDRSISQQTVYIVREYLSARKRLGTDVVWTVVPKTEVHASGLGSSASSSPKRESYYCDTATEAERQARIEKRRKIFEEIEAFQHPEIPDDFPSPAELVRQGREERDEQIFAALGGLR